MSERQINEKKAEKVSTLKGVIFTPSGSAMAPVYKRVFNKDANRNLVTKVDETDLNEFIQASASQTDLALLQKRFIELGEIPQADPNLIHGIDTTIMPNDIHGVYDMVNDVDVNFNKLPKSIQDIFGSSQAYLQSLLNGSYHATLVNAIKEKQKAAETPAANEVNKNE